MKNIQTEIISQQENAETTAFLEIKELIESIPNSDAETWIAIAKQCYKYRYKVNYVSQSTLALWRKRNRTTICHHISRLRKAGHLIIENHPYTTNSYFLPEHFYTQTYKKAFFRFIASCVLFSVTLLLSKPALDQSRTLYPAEHVIENNSRVGESLSTDPWFFGVPEEPPIPTPKKLKLSEKQTMTALDRCKKINNILKMGLPLTDHGVCKLAAYPSSCVEWAWKHVSQAMRCTDPWAYFLKKCEEYASANNLPVDWKIYYQLKRGFQVPETDETYLEANALEEFKSHQRESSAFVKQDQRPSFSKQQKLYPVYKPPIARPPLDRTPDIIREEMKDWLSKLAIAQETDNEFLKIAAENILRSLTQELEGIL